MDDTRWCCECEDQAATIRCLQASPPPQRASVWAGGMPMTGRRILHAGACCSKRPRAGRPRAPVCHATVCSQSRRACAPLLTRVADCAQCDELYCRPCWGGQHRRGARAKHRTETLKTEVEAPLQPAEPSASDTATAVAEGVRGTPPPRARPAQPALANGTLSSAVARWLPLHAQISAMSLGPEPENEAAAPVRTTSESDSDDSGGFKSSSNLAELAERCKYVPMRLTDEVRTRPIFGPRRPCSLRGRLELQVCHGSLSRRVAPRVAAGLK